MIGQALFQRKALAQQWLWVSYGAIGAGLVLIAIVFMSDDANADVKLGILPATGIMIYIQTKMRSKKPMVTIHDDHVEIDQTSLHLIRYSDIQKVERPSRRRLALVVRSDDGGTRKITIALDLLEENQGEQLAEFLSSKAAS